MSDEQPAGRPAATCAPVAEAGISYTTLELKVNFVRPITRDTGPVRCEGRVVHDGRTVATADGRVTALESGKLLAHGSATCLAFSTNGR